MTTYPHDLYPSVLGVFMISCLKAFNPLNYFFTSIDYDEKLMEIEAFLKGVYAPQQNGHEAPSRREKCRESLEKAYALASLCQRSSGKQAPETQLSLMLADILLAQALDNIATCPFSSKQLLLAALSFHLHAVGISDCKINLRDFTSLNDLTKTLENHPGFFASFESELLSLESGRCAALAYSDTFALPNRARRLFQFAETARWLSHCYCLLSGSSDKPGDDSRHFDLLTGIAEPLYLLVGDAASKKALADLYMRHWPFVHIKRNPEDMSGAEALLQKAYACDPSTLTAERIGLQRYLLGFRLSTPEQSKDVLLAIIAKAGQLEDSEDKDEFLAKLIYYYSGVLLLLETPDLEFANRIVDELQNYVTTRRACGYDSIEFALYDLRLAELKIIQNSLPEAAIAVRRALGLLQRSPQSHADDLYRALAMQKFIHDRTDLPNMGT